MAPRFLFRKIDNSALILFRIFFGILIALECYGAIVTGWVRKTLIEPKFTFNFIGFEWLQPLPGDGMYYYFILMGTLGILIALGYKYRFSMAAFTLLWAGVYFMQKTSYNNHYYLLLLISFLMVFLPADRDVSLAVRRNPARRTHSMYSYVKWIIVIQLFIVYTYASVAKLYGDWLDFTVIELLMKSRAHYFLIGEFLQQDWVHKIIGITGIAFDLLIIPALLWKPSRKIAFLLAIFFHLFNSIVLQIGIFPYLALAFTVFFFEPATLRKLFFKRKEPYTSSITEIPSFRKGIVFLMILYFGIQLLLPVRHHFIQDDVLWTEEGHRLSWRMMLRSRAGLVEFKIVDFKTKKSSRVDLDAYLTKKQQRRVAAYPDFMWQFAQHLKKEYAQKGETIGVYVASRVSINGKPYERYIDPKTDLAAIPWNPFGHHEWILPSKP